MRVLAACSLGGAGHLRPLVPFLDQVRRSGGQTLVAGPPALAAMAGATGHPFLAGGEPSEAQVRPIREQLAVLPPDEASVLGNRELFGRLAATAMLAAMERAVRDWRPDVILRDPCEYASAVVAARLASRPRRSRSAWPRSSGARSASPRPRWRRTGAGSPTNCAGRRT